jgi:hypothetical protein
MALTELELSLPKLYEVGKLGRRPETTPHPEILLSRFALREKEDLAPLPLAYDVSGGMSAYGMLGNDKYGDCVPAATEHVRMVQALIHMANNQPVYEDTFLLPNTKYTEALYFAYGIAQGEPGPKPDYGCDTYNWLLWLYQLGVIEGFAQVVDTENPSVEAVNRAMIDFQGCIVDVELNTDAQEQFARGLIWNISENDEPNPDMGHGIAKVAYTQKEDTYVTWAKKQNATLPWTAACQQQVYVVITKELADRAGYDMEATVSVLDTLQLAHPPKAA